MQADHPAGATNLADLAPRDREALLLLTQLRVLSYHQLRSACYAGADPSVTRRKIGTLRARGFVEVWEPTARAGGHTRYAAPTPATARAAVDELTSRAEGTPWAPLLRLMTPQTLRRSLHLQAERMPPWLPHQREVNSLLLRLREMLPLLWLSSWDCPFPSRIASFDLPQPDYVLVEERDGVPLLVFGEHDRGSEPLERFVARKVLLYTALAAFPEACTQHFGIPTFSVHVTVTDPVRRAPLQRLRALCTETLRAAGPAADLFRFTLAGWLHAEPNAPIWLAPSDAVSESSVRWGDHHGRMRHE